MKAAELFVRCLENEGVEYLFGLPGEENIDVMDALLESHIQFVLTRHEQGANFIDLVRYAGSFGAKGYRVQSAGDLAPMLEQAISDNRLAIIDCPVDYRENMKLTEKLGELVCPI